MYNIEKRKNFKTVGELRELLKDVKDDARITICGDYYAWFHIEEDETVVCLDNEDLDEIYDTYELLKEQEKKYGALEG